MKFAEKDTGAENKHLQRDDQKETPYMFPESLATTVNIGLIVAEKSFEVKEILCAIKKILKRLETILENTPVSYRFILPYSHSAEHEIVEMLLSDPVWERCGSKMVVIVKNPGDNGEFSPFSSDIPYKLHDARERGRKHGVDRITSEIIDMSTLIVLIGEWDPDSVKYTRESIFGTARDYGTTIVAINPLSGEMYEIPHEDRIFSSYRYLNEYNNEKVSRKKFKKKNEKNIDFIRDECRNAGIPEDMVSDVYSNLIPHFTRTKMLSGKYRRMYALTGTSVSLLAALAVLTITVQTLFFPQNPELVWVEVGEISLIIIFMMFSRQGGFHRKWIDYNFLAERIRAAFFLYVVCITCKKPDTPPHMTLAHRPNDWMVMAFESLVSTAPIPYCRLDIPFEPVKKFFLSAWINNRLEFYGGQSRASGKKFQFMTVAGETLFALVLVLAVIHATGIGHWEVYNIEASMILATLTIALPAFAAALGHVRVQREYLRNSERYSHIVRHITSIKNEMYHVNDMNALCSLLEEMNEITLREQQDWRILFRFRKIEAI